MTQNEEMRTSADSGFLSTKFGRLLFIIVAALLAFAGPTYVIYVLNVVLNLDLAVAALTGFILFVIGLLMMRYLVKLKIVT